MCEYCKNVRTGDDYNPMISEFIPMGYFGRLLCDVVMAKKDGMPVISLQYGNTYMPDACGKEVSVKVNYCPMCGEKLGEVSDAGNN